MSNTGVNGQLRVVVCAGMQQAVHYATRARDSQNSTSRVAGQELEYLTLQACRRRSQVLIADSGVNVLSQLEHSRVPSIDNDMLLLSGS
ncbi:unnamed protein product [Ectocarpus sp. 13 AM-2016]